MCQERWGDEQASIDGEIVSKHTQRAKASVDGETSEPECAKSAQDSVDGETSEPARKYAKDNVDGEMSEPACDGKLSEPTCAKIRVDVDGETSDMDCKFTKKQYPDWQTSGLIHTHVRDVHPDQEDARLPGDERDDHGDEATHQLHAQHQGDVPGDTQQGAADNHPKIIQSTTIKVVCPRCVGFHDTPSINHELIPNLIGYKTQGCQDCARTCQDEHVPHAPHVPHVRHVPQVPHDQHSLADVTEKNKKHRPANENLPPILTGRAANERPEVVTRAMPPARAVVTKHMKEANTAPVSEKNKKHRPANENLPPILTGRAANERPEVVTRAMPPARAVVTKHMKEANTAPVSNSPKRKRGESPPATPRRESRRREEERKDEERRKFENSLKFAKSKLRNHDVKISPLKPETTSVKLGTHIQSKKSTKLKKEEISKFKRKSSSIPEIWKDFYTMKPTKPPQNLWREKADSKFKIHGAKEQQQELKVLEHLG
jgi:hypothetical protein